MPFSRLPLIRLPSPGCEPPMRLKAVVKIEMPALLGRAAMPVDITPM